MSDDTIQIHQCQFDESILKEPLERKYLVG